MCRSAHYSTDHIRSVVDELKPLRRVGGGRWREGGTGGRKGWRKERKREGWMEGECE